LSPLLPDIFLDSLKKNPGFDREAFVRVHAGKPATGIRLNPLKCPASEISLKEGSSSLFSFPLGAKIPWSTMGYFLADRPSFTLDPLMHAGVYYVQDPSSMFLEQALRCTAPGHKPLRVLDLCASPGGKSTLTLSLLPSGSLLVSNEVIQSRTGVLRENLVKWGAHNVFVTQNDPADFGRLENYFDIILVDAPCSGSGLFRKDPESIRTWDEKNVMHCAHRQQRILRDVWPSLRMGGSLIYSTCSYSKEENEDILDFLLQEYKAEARGLILPVTLQGRNWQIIETRGSAPDSAGYRFYPDKLDGEGFFLACIRKEGDGEFSYPKSHKAPWSTPGPPEIARADPWLADGRSLAYFSLQEKLFAFPEGLWQDLSFLGSRLYLKKAGVCIGKMAGNELVPSHELALSTLSSPGLPVRDLSLEESLQYLRKEEFPYAMGRKGWTLVRFRQQNLGWVKVLDKRVNNYYPKEWKIYKKA
jgi:16S rRNA C967 or C1407 C5-methylase (RsmB/RsmF family)/NOL1/NOP2/fmu family ribosome biogenesis protein